MCGLALVQRASDGTIEFVSEASANRFTNEGAKCLVWNNQPDLSRFASSKKQFVEKEGLGTMASGALDTGLAVMAEEDE